MLVTWCMPVWPYLGNSICRRALSDSEEMHFAGAARPFSPPAGSQRQLCRWMIGRRPVFVLESSVSYFLISPIYDKLIITVNFNYVKYPGI